MGKGKGGKGNKVKTPAAKQEATGDKQRVAWEKRVVKRLDHHDLKFAELESFFKVAVKLQPKDKAVQFAEVSDDQEKENTKRTGEDWEKVKIDFLTKLQTLALDFPRDIDTETKYAFGPGGVEKAVGKWEDHEKTKLKSLIKNFQDAALNLEPSHIKRIKDGKNNWFTLTFYLHPVTVQLLGVASDRTTQNLKTTCVWKNFQVFKSSGAGGEKAAEQKEEEKEKVTATGPKVVAPSPTQGPARSRGRPRKEELELEILLAEREKELAELKEAAGLNKSTKKRTDNEELADKKAEENKPKVSKVSQYESVNENETDGAPASVQEVTADGDK